MSTIELAIVTQVVKIVLGIVALNFGSKNPNSLLSAYDSSGLATSGGLNMGDSVKKGISVIATSNGEVYLAAELIGSYTVPKSIDIVQKSLAERLTYSPDKDIEVNLTRENPVQLFVNLYNLERSRNRDSLRTAESLTSDTLSTLSSIGNDKQSAILDGELIPVAKSNMRKSTRA